jgi:hypothetical protein
MRRAEPVTRRAFVCAPWGSIALLVATAPAVAFDGEKNSYPVSEFVVEYGLDHPDYPPVQEVLDLEVGLRATERGFVAPRPVDTTYRMKLHSLPQNARFFPSALEHITWYIALNYRHRGLDGIFVSIPEIEPETGRDLRDKGNTKLRLRIWTGRVGDRRRLPQFVAPAEGSPPLPLARNALVAHTMNPAPKNTHRNPKPIRPAMLSAPRAQRSPRTKIVNRNT